MGKEMEHGERALIFKPYQLSTDTVMAAAPDVIVLHCLPAHRREAIAAEVMDGPNWPCSTRPRTASTPRRPCCRGCSPAPPTRADRTGHRVSEQPPDDAGHRRGWPWAVAAGLAGIAASTLATALAAAVAGRQSDLALQPVELALRVGLLLVAPASAPSWPPWSCHEVVAAWPWWPSGSGCRSAPCWSCGWTGCATSACRPRCSPSG